MDRGASPENPWVFPLETNNPIVAKKRAYEILKEEWNNGEFQRLNSGPIGTHSLRKYPSTYSRRCGCSRDDTDFRGRWKRTKKQIDTYIDVELPYPDAKDHVSMSLLRIADSWMSGLKGQSEESLSDCDLEAQQLQVSSAI